MNKELLNLAIPNILSNLTIPLVSLVDIALMGHMPSKGYIVSIGFGVMIFNFVYWSFGFLRMGTTGVVSQAYGSDNLDKAMLVLKQSILIGFAGALSLILFQDYIWYFAKFIIGAESSISNHMYIYYKIRIWAAPATILTYVYTGWFLGMQNSKSVLYLTLLVNVSNALLSYLLVFKFGLDIRGVAIGTLIAQYLGLLFCIIYLRAKYNVLFVKLFKKGDSIRFGLKDLLFLNGNIFIRTFSLIVVLSLFKILAGKADSNLGAANILLLEFVTISAYGIDGFAFAAESLCGKYFGTNKINLFKKAVSTSFVWGILSACFFSLLFLIAGKSILQLLTDKVEIIHAAQAYLPWLILAPIVNSIAFIWDGVYIGATASSLMRNTMLLSGVLFLGTVNFFENTFGNHGLWMALLLFMLCRGLLQTFFYKRGILSKISA